MAAGTHDMSERREYGRLASFESMGVRRTPSSRVSCHSRSAMKLQGRSAIITGGTSGLGYAIASAFLVQGANVAICGRDSQGVDKACGSLAPEVVKGRRLLGLAADVSCRDQMEDLIHRSLVEFGEIDILINN